MGRNNQQRRKAKARKKGSTQARQVVHGPPRIVIEDLCELLMESLARSTPPPTGVRAEFFSAMAKQPGMADMTLVAKAFLDYLYSSGPIHFPKVKTLAGYAKIMQSCGGGLIYAFLELFCLLGQENRSGTYAQVFLDQLSGILRAGELSNVREASQAHRTLLLCASFFGDINAAKQRQNIVVPLVRTYVRKSPFEHLGSFLAAFLKLKKPTSKQKTTQKLEFALSPSSIQNVELQWRQSLAQLLDLSLNQRLSAKEKAALVQAMPNMASLLNETLGLLRSDTPSLSSLNLRASTADQVLALVKTTELPYQETVFAAVFRARGCANDWTDFPEKSELSAIQSARLHLIQLTTTGVPEEEEPFARKSLDLFGAWTCSKIVEDAQPLCSSKCMAMWQKARPNDYRIAVLGWLVNDRLQRGESKAQPWSHIDFEVFFFALHQNKKPQIPSFLKRFYACLSLQAKQDFISQYCQRLLLSSDDGQVLQYWNLLWQNIAPLDAEPLASVLAGRPVTTEFLTYAAMIVNRKKQLLVFDLDQTLQVLRYATQLKSGDTEFAEARFDTLIGLIEPKVFFSETAIVRGSLSILAKFISRSQVCEFESGERVDMGLHLLRAAASRKQSMPGLMELARVFRYEEEELALELKAIATSLLGAEACTWSGRAGPVHVKITQNDMDGESAEQ